jgi:uncharacterized protein YndB with AHSA1/START domain
MVTSCLYITSVTHGAIVVSGAIAAPMEQVFAIISDPTRIPEWLPGCRAVGGTPLIRQGSWLDVSFGERTSSFRITDFHPPFSFGWAEHGRREGSRTSIQLGSVGTETAIRMQQIVPPIPAPWLKGKLKERRDPKKQLDQTLRNLRRLLGF